MRYYDIALKCKSGALEMLEVCFNNKKQMLHYALDCFKDKHTECKIFYKGKMIMMYKKGEQV